MRPSPRAALIACAAPLLFASCREAPLAERIAGRYSARGAEHASHLELRPDGTLLLAGTAPGDRAEMMAGRWTSAADTAFLQVDVEGTSLAMRAVLRGDSLYLSSERGPFGAPFIRER